VTHTGLGSSGVGTREHLVDLPASGPASLQCSKSLCSLVLKPRLEQPILA
jgi:hypothetical protein